LYQAEGQALRYPFLFFAAVQRKRKECCAYSTTLLKQSLSTVRLWEFLLALGDSCLLAQNSLFSCAAEPVGLLMPYVLNNLSYSLISCHVASKLLLFSRSNGMIFCLLAVCAPRPVEVSNAPKRFFVREESIILEIEENHFVA
jgi:hypothetical protein